MAASSARFVGIVNANYAALAALPRAVPDTQDLAVLLRERHHFQPIVLANLGRAELLDAIEEHLGCGVPSDGTLIVSWTGHAQIGVDGTLRLLGISGTRDVEVASAGQLGEWAARSGAQQVLVLIDTCYSGGGLVDATRVANAVNSGRASPGSAWFGVFAASLSDEPARSGAMARELLRLLAQGPRQPDFRWDKTRPYIRGDDLAQALLKDWDEERQTPYAMSFGRAWDLVCNPLHEAGITDQPIEHLLLAARGSSSEESFFTGRKRALARLTEWMARGRAGLFVVTGPPGCGKSAVVGRIVSLSSPAERKKLQQSAAIASDLDPGEASVDAQLQARGVTVDTASEELARQLGVDLAEGLFGVLAEARRRHVAGDPLVVVVDGLDEARAFSRELAVELLAPLAQEALVVVATRDLAIGETTLVALLGPTTNVMDLGEDPEDTLRAVREYVLRRLEGVDASMDPSRVADELAPVGGAFSAAPFLLARLVTSQLRDHPVDTTSGNWKLALATTVESALERDLQSVALVIDGKPHPTAAREIFRALALAHGSGFPADDVWPAVATAISTTHTTYSRDDAYAVLAALGRHIVAGSEADQPVYRIAHQRLVDYLAGDSSRDTATLPQRTVTRAVAAAVFAVYDELLNIGLGPRAHAYLWRYAWRHLAEAGAPGLNDLRRLADRDRGAFLPDLALGLEFAGLAALSAGQADEGLASIEEAVAARRELQDPLRLATSLFHLSTARGAVGDEDGADAAAREASAIAGRFRDDPQGRAVFSTALLTRAVTQLREGRSKAAKRLADEAIALEEPAELTTGNAGRLRLVQAYALAGLSASVLGDQEEAARLCNCAVDLIDAHDLDEGAGLVLIEPLSSLALVQFLQALQAAPDASGTYAAAVTTAGERVLRDYRRTGRRGGVWDILTTRGLLFLTRGRALNMARGLADAVSAEECLAVLDDAIELVRPHAGQFADATILLADGLRMRAGVLSQSDPAAAAATLEDAICSLRRFSSGNTQIAVELGAALDARTQQQVPQAINGAVVDATPLIDGQQEAVALLRRGGAWTHRMALAAALGRLALLQLGQKGDLDIAARGEAIDVWRSLIGIVPEAPEQLVSNLIDQAARLIDTRLAEGADLAQEALQHAVGLPQPRFSVLRGFSELNLAAAQIGLGTVHNARELLEAAIVRLEPSAALPVVAAALANAYMNVAQLDVLAARFGDALPRAERATMLFETAGIPAFASANRPLAYIVLGQAQRGAGQTALGTETLRRWISTLVDAALKGQNDGGVLINALNLAATEMWDEVLVALGDQPEVLRRFSIRRRRPAPDIHLTVQTLVDALGSAVPAQRREVRAVARAHRAYAAVDFDAAWRDATSDLPAWLQVDPMVENIAIAWLNTPTWELSRDYLQSHPILLGAGTDIVLEEFAFAVADRTLIERHQQLLTAARTQGADAAYAPLLLDIEVSAWLRSADPQEHLAEHTRLLRPEVLALLRRRADQGGDETAAAFAAILELAQRDERQLAFEAAEHPASMLEHLQAAWRSTDIARLSALATIVLHWTTDAGVKRRAAVALLIARALERRETQSEPWIAAALEHAGDDRQTLTGLVTDAIVHHPAAAAELASLIPILAA